VGGNAIEVGLGNEARGECGALVDDTEAIEGAFEGFAELVEGDSHKDR
jgi:hypothetical protein